jgi:nitroimidazol reductase NimA-like FMN-containing flavoprotein (pyridoxamine 5'-phosphate oxidase superfamily)
MAMPIYDDLPKTFEVLDDEQCLWLLDSNFIGRVGVTVGALPAIFTVNYAMNDGAIYFLTSRGTKLAAALRGAAVAFHIDSVDLRYHRGWSVQAIGMAEEVAPDEAPEIVDRLALQPWAPGVREHLVRIRPELLSGRSIGVAHR